MSDFFQATVVITTRNRSDDLRRALLSCQNQTASIETLVIDDGSTDGTASMVSTEFPSVRLVHHDESKGLIVRRNEAAALAGAEMLISIDDDAAFPSPNTIAQTLAEFTDARIAAIAIPYIDVNKSQTVLVAPSDGREPFVTHFYIGTAHAVRKSVFLALGGYRPQLVHQGEELDFGIRLLDAGYVIRAGRADAIHHFESPRRDYRRMDYYGRRNNILFAWHNVPRWHLPAHLIGTTLLGLRAIIKTGRPLAMTRGMLNGWFSILTRWSERRPVRPEVYRIFRRLMRDGSMKMTDVFATLPSIFKP